MLCLRQSTSVDVGIGPFLDSGDGNTQETALVITQPDIRLKKNGAAWAQKAAAQTLTHEEFGWYEVTLDATDTNTLGILLVAIHETGALAVWAAYMVLPAEVWDALFAGSGVGIRADVRTWLGASIPTPGTAGVPLVDTVRISGTVQTATDLSTRLPAALTANGHMKADLLALNGDLVSPVVLDRSARSIVRVTIGVASGLISIVTSSLDPAPTDSDQFAGRVLIFDRSTTTTGLRNQARVIEHSTAGAGAVLTLVSPGVTSPPVSGDLAVIV